MACPNDKKTYMINDDNEPSLITWKISQVPREVLSHGKISIKSHKNNFFEKKQLKAPPPKKKEKKSDYTIYHEIAKKHRTPAWI